MGDQTPKYTSISGWCALTGMSRSGTYVALARGELRAIKVNGRTLVDVDAGLSWPRTRPPANIGAAEHTAKN